MNRFCLFFSNNSQRAIRRILFKSKIDSETNEDFPKINENIIEKQELIDQLEKNVIWQIDYDRKTKALKQLQ